MKTTLLLLFTLFQITTYSQNKLVKDLDADRVMDSVYVDTIRSVIVCRLSTQQFRKMESKPIEILNESSGIAAAKNGFYFNNNWMRAGYSNQFRYDAKTKKIMLIGMSRYEFGNAANDGSGESSVNLVTGSYIGNWNYYDQEKEELISIPTIKTKIKLTATDLESFSENTYFGFAEKCSGLYYKGKEKMINRK
ncbi:hypothetical protein R1T16_09170 [Flavobacterium sp. DG1-102-2]|uniref:hypothetical protein n=1 Tax=Flavobacterium sp. DG1-102-2 TaxID=3081663 RepID=UPI00294A9457|nr:hypothetical protein [Flavobacterium sp. DG1-102-2]MDV6168592.1 hypothetical protein [Flavobacterium sp. DG1-102-2]